MKIMTSIKRRMEEIEEEVSEMPRFLESGILHRVSLLFWSVPVRTKHHAD
jgi:hypothetical protein